MWSQCFAVVRFKINISYILVVAKILYLKKFKEVYRRKERKSREEMVKEFMKETSNCTG